MYCMNCGSPLPNNANFCLKCSKSQRENVQTPQQKPEQWETCEIVWTEVQKGGLFKGGSIMYWARATGPNGVYLAAQSEVIKVLGAAVLFDIFHFDMKSETFQKERKAVESLVAQLQRDGWLVVETPSCTPMVPTWWTCKLRRRVPQAS